MTTATDLPDLASLRDERRLLRADLGRLRGRLRRELALEFAVGAAALLVASASVLVLLDWWYRPGRVARVWLLTVVAAALLARLVVAAVRLRRASRLDELGLAMTLDRYRPGVGQQIADVLQLPDLIEGEPSSSSSASPAMVRLAVRRASEALAGSDWRSLWNRRRTAAFAGALVVALVIPAAFALAAPDAARLSVARWLLGSRERWPQRTYLTVMGLDNRGRLLCPRDERFVLEVRSDMPMVERRGGRWLVRGRSEPLPLRRKPEAPHNPASVVVRERTAEGATRSAPMVASGPAQFRYEFPPSPSSSSVELSGDDDWLGPIRIERVDRPSLSGIRLRVTEPGASKGPRTIDDPRQHLVFLPDTRVELTLEGSEPIADARLKVHPGRAPALDRLGERTFSARWTLREAITLEILMTSRDTGLESKPAFLSLGLLKDREPRVSVRALGVGGHVTPVATIPLTIAATDDLGLAALRLRAERTTAADDKDKDKDKEKDGPKTERKTIPLPLSTDEGHAVLDRQVRHDVILQADPPKVGTTLRFVGEAEDRCARGAQVGRSGALQMQVVSPDELFYEILIRQRAERAKFVAVVESEEAQGPVLAGSPSSDAFLRAMRVQHSGARQLDQIASRLVDTLQEMKLNQVGSPKSHRLLQEGVIEPIRALNAGPLNELRGVLQALAGAGPKAGATKESARRLHASVLAEMKRILDQMSQWESFVDVVNQVAEVIKLQQKVVKDSEKARESRTQEVFDEKP